MAQLMRLLAIIVLSVFAFSAVNGQLTSYEDQLKLDLERRGISFEEFSEILIDQGIDPSTLNNLSAIEFQELQNLVQQYDRELFLRKLNKSNNIDTIPSIIQETVLDTINQALLDSLDNEIDSLPEEVIYGHGFFRSGQIGLIETNSGYSPPDSYILGAGDQISVSIYSNVVVEDNLAIGTDGTVRIYRDGQVKVTIAGLSVADARFKLLRAYRNYYSFSPNQFQLNVSSLRTVRVAVYGEVVKQGDYNISAANGVTNIIAAAGGITDNGSVRNIQLVKRSGEVLNFDLYQLVAKPNYNKQFNLDDGDYIVVPAAQKIVRIEGAITREAFYELVTGDELFELIEYAGGISSGALLSSFRMKRFEENRRIVKDIPYAELVKQQKDFPLMNGDEITISKIEDKLENYVSVKGEVRNEGNYELIEGLTLKDVILQARPKTTTKMDFAKLTRINERGEINVLTVSIEDALNGVGQSSTIMMRDKDVLEVFPLERFIDNKYIKIAGAVRIPDEFEYDEGGTIKASDLIRLAGGLRSDASTIAHVHRLDPLNPNELEYVTIDLERLTTDERAVDNIYLQPYDSIHVYSRNEFIDNVFIKVSGAVNKPGEFQYGMNMTLKDAILLAGGFRRSASTNNIEISRIIFQDNKPTKTVIQRAKISRNELGRKGSDEFILEPNDNVFVRYVPQFELQQNVVIKGEVTVPGEYSLIKDNETLRDIITRAGGLTQEAFPAAATLYRAEDSLGLIVIKLDEVLNNPNSLYNSILTGGDTLTIPKRYDFVKIIGATQYLENNDEKQINPPYHKGKDALFYIDKYAGGFADNARKDKIFVKYPNGEIRTSKKRLFGKKYPEVLPGSEIIVGRIKRDLRSGKEEENVNWTKVLGDSVAQAMSILTLILLVQRLD